MEKPSEWKLKFQEIYQLCSEELKKTTEIGRKMLSASRTNSSLHEAYEELGMLAAKAMKESEINWENSRVEHLMKIIDNCQSDLNSIEKEVNDIRFAEEAQNGGEKSDLPKKEEH
ncbi:MAG: hypothetical protein NXH75_07830 [Halobacteriovoraceae bacterium]|nr:hypothetical protein [Halobacteriovoraceae bacterium]